MKPESALMVFAAIMLTSAAVIWMQAEPTATFPVDSSTTSSTAPASECQDHTLPCAGPPITAQPTTVPPRHVTSTTTTVTLPRTS